MKKTVLILGAGSSKVYGFPTGPGLKDCICHGTLVSQEDLNYLKINNGMWSAFQQALMRAGRISIDSFLEMRKDLEYIGKFAIANALLSREKENGLFDDWPAHRVHAELNGFDPRGDWYELLFNILTEHCKFEDISFKGVGIITFNYERSLEHFFHTALMNSYMQSEKAAGEKLNEMEVVHVHGSLGRLSWQSGDDPVVPYGIRSAPNMEKAIKCIKVMHEAARTSTEFKRAQRLIRSADQVLFLGFGFDRQSLARLGMDKMTNPSRFGGTILGLPPRRRAQIAAEFPHVLSAIDPGYDRSAWVDKDVYKYMRDDVPL